MDNSFSVAGPLLDALHLPECEGAEFELDMRVVMKRHKVVPHSCLGIASALYPQPRAVALTSLL
jgi:hypothetical protein